MCILEESLAEKQILVYSSTEKSFDIFLPVLLTNSDIKGFFVKYLSSFGQHTANRHDAVPLNPYSCKSVEKTQAFSLSFLVSFGMVYTP